MEAPDKIYLIRNFSSPTALNTTNDHHGKFLNEWYKSREKDSDIEYIRTDVFIEKACGYILSNIPDMHILGGSCCMDECIINDFKKYMKGE